MKNGIRTCLVILMLCISFKAHAAPTSQDLKKVIDTVPLKHAWKIQPFFDSWEFVSTFKAPIPFSMKGEAEAVMSLAVPPEKMSPEAPMAKILKDEIDGIQKELRVTEPLDMDKDHKAVNNIISYTEKMGKTEVGFLEYRIRGEKKDPPGMPRSVRQILFVKGDQLYIVTLVVLFAGHQDEVRSDQKALVKAFLP